MSATGSVERLVPGEAGFAGAGFVRRDVFADARSGAAAGDAAAASNGADWPRAAPEEVASSSTLPNEAGDGADASAFDVAAAPNEITAVGTGAVFTGNAAVALTGAVKGNRVAKIERIEIERA